jgi:hypothetical protein
MSSFAVMKSSMMSLLSFYFLTADHAGGKVKTGSSVVGGMMIVMEGCVAERGETCRTIIT